MRTTTLIVNKNAEKVEPHSLDYVIDNEDNVLFVLNDGRYVNLDDGCIYEAFAVSPVKIAKTVTVEF